MSNSCIAIVSIFNRPSVTARFLLSLSEANYSHPYLSTVYIVDTHPTANSFLASESYSFDIQIIKLDPSYWWCSAMKYGISHVLAREPHCDRLLLMNDDLEVNSQAFSIFTSSDARCPESDVLVGAVVQDNLTTYGIRSLKYGLFFPSFPIVPPHVSLIDSPSNMYTFNANWISIACSTYLRIGGLGNYTHAFGDLDLGLRAFKSNLNINYFSSSPIGSLISDNGSDYKLLHKKSSLGRHKPYERLLFMHAHFSPYYQFVEFFRQFFFSNFT